MQGERLRSRLFQKSVCLAGLAGLLVLLPQAAAPQGSVRAQVEEAPGLKTVSFDTPQGRVSVYLPDGVQRRDTISGTVSLTPAGSTPKERERNQGTLSGYVVEIGRHQVPARDPWWTWTVPPDFGGRVDVVLVPARGRPLARAEVPVLAGSAPPPASDFVLPEIGQTGRPILVAGPFDGRLDTGRLTVSGVDATPLVQSPRQAVFTSPPGVVGPAKIQLEEGGKTVTGPFRNVAVNLSAPRLDLKRGEQTTLTVEASGLTGLDRRLPIRLTNGSPQVVTVSGGNDQTVVITPTDVGTDGIYSWRRPLTGVKVGAFDIRADLVISSPPAQTVQAGAPKPETPELVGLKVPEDTCECENLAVYLEDPIGLGKKQELVKADEGLELKVSLAPRFDIECKGKKAEKCTSSIKMSVAADLGAEKCPQGSAEKSGFEDDKGTEVKPTAQRTSYFAGIRQGIRGKGGEEREIGFGIENACPCDLTSQQVIFNYFATFEEKSLPAKGKLRIDLTPDPDGSCFTTGKWSMLLILNIKKDGDKWVAELDDEGSDYDGDCTVNKDDEYDFDPRKQKKPEAKK